MSETRSPGSLEEATPVSIVLVVDDDPDINRLLQVRLRSRGYKIHSAPNGEQALVVLADIAPDLMFLDVSMPGIGGLEVLQNVRSRGYDMAVIMMTAFGSEEVAIEALRFGADDYLRKPFEPTEFKAVLERTVTRLELTRQNVVLRKQLDQKRKELEAELARAANVQMTLLPRTPPRLHGFELAGACLPAREVGGDFFDWHEPERGTLTITLGDVMGKGMPAALLMATIRSTLRALSQRSSPDEVMNLAGRALEVDLDRVGSFMTLFYGQLDLQNRRLAYVDAGHGHVMFLRAGGEVEELLPRGLPLGLNFGDQYRQGAISFGVGDSLVVYSDGLIDAMPDLAVNPRALASLVKEENNAQQTVDNIVGVAKDGGQLTDDLTIVALRCTSG